MNLPKYLYKYVSFDTQSLENLKANRLYFGSPKGFNDPYDCATNPVVLKPTQDEAELVVQHYLNEITVPDDAKQGLKNIAVEDFRNMLLKSGSDSVKIAVEEFKLKRGVTCFSEVKDDLLMWSHYGGKYKGFCLEFSTEHKPFDNAKRVIYHEKIPSVSAIPFLLDEGANSVENFFCIKSKSWGYEKEWRVIHAEAGTLYHYSSEAITGIYFGPDISSEAFEIICLILKGQNESIKFFQGKLSETEFKVDFHEINYTPHLAAKKLGLI